MRVRGSGVGDVKVQVEAREGEDQQGNDVRGNVRAEKKPRAWRGPA